MLGLDDLQERAYRRLVEAPSDSADSIADALGATLSSTVAALDALELKGMVARPVADPDRFVASPPVVALGSMIVQQQEEIRAAERELGVLAARYRESAEGRTHTDVIDVVEGPQAVAQRFAQLQRGASTEVLALVKSGVAVVSAEENVDEQIATDRGVSYRVVLERAAFESPGFLERASESVAAGEEVRVTNEVPLRMIVADRQLALLPLRPTTESATAGALLVHPSGLLDAMVTLFDLVWRQSNPLVVGATGLDDGAAAEVDDTDVRLLSLLLAGLTDQAIGGQLGLSLRTVQRRVHQLMQRAGVATRFQLGHAAATRGWLGSDV